MPSHSESSNPHAGELASKILSLDALVARRRTAASIGEKVVHCHGCFDIVHPGHIRHLRHAAKLGDRLVVSITADRLIRKGTGRPLFDQELRAENLAALSLVDWVHVCDDETAVELLDAVQPDVYVKGREYEENDDPRFAMERAAVERHGGRVVFSSGDLVFSSTALINAMASGAHDGAQAYESPELARLRGLQRRHDLSYARMGTLMSGFARQRVVIVGDVLQDTYTHCAWPEVAGESPMMNLRPLEQTAYDGGAAIVAKHVAALGAHATLVTALPNDDAAKRMRERLEADGIDVLAVPSQGRMPEKERLLVGRNKVVKLDRSGVASIDAAARTEMVTLAIAASKSADAAIVTDFGLGLLTTRSTAALFDALRPRVRTLAGDVSGPRETLLAMRGADWLSPSEMELRGAVGDQSTSLPVSVWEAREATGARTIAVTLSEEGMVIFEPNPEAPREDEGWPSRLLSEHVPALSDSAIDPLGCGDALLSTAALVLASGGTAVEAGYLGSVAAAVEASMLGNVAVGVNALARRLRGLDEPSLLVQTADRGARVAG